MHGLDILRPIRKSGDDNEFGNRQQIFGSPDAIWPCGLRFSTKANLITRADDFPDKRPYPLLDHFNPEIKEWGSTTPITPLARIKITPEDFPYLDQVQFNS